MEHRMWAHPFDRPIKLDEDKTWGVGPNPDAVTGYDGIGWHSHFVDHESGEVYQVACSDGVNGGKGAHRPEHERWMEAARQVLWEGAKVVLDNGGSEYRISAREWNLLSNYIMPWLDAPTGATTGVVGTSHGLPVVVDPGLAPLVGNPP